MALEINMNLVWAIVFQKDGLNYEWMNDYLNSVDGTKIIQTIECVTDVTNINTGEDRHVPVVCVLLKTEGFFIPVKFMLELNLRKAFSEEDIRENKNLRYIYVPEERAF